MCSSDLAVFGDGGWAGGANKFMRAPMGRAEGDPRLVAAGTQAFRHWGGCSCRACLDGHVSTTDVPERGASTREQDARWISGYPRNGFLSADDAAYGGD